MHQLGVALRGHDALARHQHDRIAGQHADERESDEGDADEGRDQDRQTAENKSQH